MVRRGHGVCTSISFNFHARCRIEIRFSDNPQQKDTVGDIIWGRRKKYVIYRLDILFSISHVVQSMVSKINLFCQKDICRYPKRDIGRKNQTSYHVRKLKNGNAWLFLCDTWLRYLKKLQFIFTETRQISSLSQDVFLSDLVMKNFAEFSDKFFHIQYATLEMFMGVLNNHAILMFLFNQQPLFCNVLKNVSHQYYATNQDTKPHILL